MYKVIVGAGSTIQGALYSLQTEVNNEMVLGWSPVGGATLALVPTELVRGMGLNATYVYSQGMVKHESHGDGTDESGHRVGSAEG